MIRYDAVQSHSSPGNAGPTADAHDLWAQLPDHIAETFEPHARILNEFVLREVQRAVPEYAATDPQSEQKIITSVEHVITRCLSAVLGYDEPTECRSVFTRLGRSEFEDGRNLDYLQAAYRAAGRAAWQYLSAFSRENGLAPELISVAAEAIFATIDDISRLSVEGYTEARLGLEGVVKHHRSRLLSLLTADTPPTPGAVDALATEAEWPVPTHVRVVALTPLEDGPPTGIALDRDVLRDLDGPRPCLLTGAPDTHLGHLDTRLGGRRAAIGPLVRVTEAAESLRCARRALALAVEGTLSDQRVIRCDDHLMSLWLTSDTFLSSQLRKRVLAPFEPLKPEQRTRLEDTLLAWLSSNGKTGETAEALRIHPQTVRYRMHKIDAMFGAQLDDPDIRLAMEMALRSSALLGRTTETSEPADHRRDETRRSGVHKSRMRQGVA